MIVFERGQQLTKNDLNIFIRDDQGNLVDPSSITYTIYDRTGSKPVLVGGSMDQVPARESVGYYWANMAIEGAESLGEYEIEWGLRRLSSSNLEVVKQRFSIIKTKDPLAQLSTTGGVAYFPGQILGQTELYINVLNERNNPFDPEDIWYQIFDRTTGLDVLQGSSKNVPVKVKTGMYYANYQIPSSANVGDWYIKWSFKEHATDPQTRSVVQEFAVVGSGSEVSSIYSDNERTLIRRLRFLLRDNNPDRNYHFVPPENEKVIQNYTETFGFIWTDEELYEYLTMAQDAVNMYPPIEQYTLTGLPSFLHTIVVVKAAVFALFALSINWAHDEFDYSIGGVSLNIDKSSKYQGMGESLETQYQTSLERYKDFGVKYVMGIQQPRYGIGISAALGPFSSQGIQNRRNFISSNRV